ncbi:MAG: hypothetical protein AB7O73_15825 [Bacteroidia bacterium]
MRTKTENKQSTIETNAKRHIDVVTDSPLNAPIKLNEQIDLLSLINDKSRPMIYSKTFTEKFSPSMLIFVSKDNTYSKFKPTVVIQIEANPLEALNMTLADYMESSYTITKEIQTMIGERQVRTGSTAATQWYRCKLTNVFGMQVETDIEYIQFQKIVVSNDLMGIITLSYTDETKPDDIKILQELLLEFGIKQ